MKQGAACVGCKVGFLSLKQVAFTIISAIFSQNKDHVVLATLKRPASKLCDSPQKIFKIDENIGCAISGITADGTAVIKSLRSYCISNHFTFDSKAHVHRLANEIANTWQLRAHRAGSRPPGVGLLLAGADAHGCHLKQICPSGNIYDHCAAAVGARSEASKTYLESFLHEFESSNLENMISIAVRALKESSSTEQFIMDDCTVAVVGGNSGFRILQKNELNWIDDHLNTNKK